MYFFPEGRELKHTTGRGLNLGPFGFAREVLPYAAFRNSVVLTAPVVTDIYASRHTLSTTERDTLSALLGFMTGAVSMIYDKTLTNGFGTNDGFFGAFFKSTSQKPFAGMLPRAVQMSVFSLLCAKALQRHRKLFPEEHKPAVPTHSGPKA